MRAQCEQARGVWLDGGCLCLPYVPPPVWPGPRSPATTPRNWALPALPDLTPPLPPVGSATGKRPRWLVYGVALIVLLAALRTRG